VRRGIAAIAGVIAAAGVTGCQSNACTTPGVVVDDTDGGGVMLEGSWASGPPDGPWIMYSGGETLTFKYPAGFVATGLPTAWASTAAYQDAGAGTFVIAAGQLAEFTSEATTSISVTNQSCANYYFYMEVPGNIVAAGADAAVLDGGKTSDPSRD
jgi:hypothetical protein